MIFFTIMYILFILGALALIGYGYYKDYKKSPGYFKFTIQHLGKYVLLALLAIAIYYIIFNLVK